MNFLLSLFVATSISAISYAPLSRPAAARLDSQAVAFIDRSAQYMNMYWGQSEIPDDAEEVSAHWTVQLQDPESVDFGVKFWIGDGFLPAERVPVGSGTWTFEQDDPNFPVAEFYFTDAPRKTLFIDLEVCLELTVDGETTTSGPHHVRLWNALKLDRADFTILNRSSGRSQYAGKVSGGPVDVGIEWTWYEIWLRKDGTYLDAARVAAQCAGNSGLVTLPPHKFDPAPYFWKQDKTYKKGTYVVDSANFYTYISNLNGNSGNRPSLSSGWRLADIRPTWWPKTGTNFPLVPPNAYGLYVEPVGIGLDESGDPAVSDYHGVPILGDKPGFWFPPPGLPPLRIISL